MDEKARPRKMDVSIMIVAELYSHEDWVAWTEAGPWPGDEEYGHYQEVTPSLDSIGGTGREKSKGKGKNGKGFGSSFESSRVDATAPQFSCGLCNY